ncbi:RNA polymerase sigma factor [Flavitalea flava]
MALPGLRDEKQLFCQISEGDQIAFRTFFDMYRTRIYEFVCRMTKSGDTAEEITQEIFLKIWTHRSNLREVQNPPGYLFTLARNKTINALSKIATDEKLRQNLWRQLNEVQNTPEDQLQFKESNQLIESALVELSPRKQRIFHMSRHLGLTHEQIAEELQLSKSTVKNNLVDTLKWLRTSLKDHIGIIIILLMLEELYK